MQFDKYERAFISDSPSINPSILQSRTDFIFSYIKKFATQQIVIINFKTSITFSLTKILWQIHNDAFKDWVKSKHITKKLLQTKRTRTQTNPNITNMTTDAASKTLHSILNRLYYI